MVTVDALLLNVLTERPVLVGIIAVLLLIVLGIYLMLRRTLLAFTEGMRKGRGD